MSSTRIQVVPKDVELYDVAYPDTAVVGGESLTVTPDQADLPAGTKIALGDNPELIAEGWDLGVTTGGELTATAPVDADGTFAIALTVTYPDGTSEPATAEVTATPAPKDVELHDVTYPDTAVMGGESLTITPDQADLPAGTKITLGDNTELIAEGWDLKVTTDGELTVTTPTQADGTFGITLTVTYPDGTSEATTAEVTATPAPKDVEDDEGDEGDEGDQGDQPIAPNRPKTGGSSFGSS